MPTTQQSLSRFLIIQTASIGDVILATPIAEKLHSFYPHASIDMLVKKGNEPLFDRHPFIRKILVWDKKRAKYQNLLNIIKLIRSEQYDCVINLQRFASSGIITALSGARLKIGFDKNPLSVLFNVRIKHQIGTGSKHEIERNLELIESITDHSNRMPRLYPDSSVYESVLTYKHRPYITISPASLWFTKQFPEERWAEFVGQLNSNMLVYFLGSPADTALCDRIIAAASHKQSVNLAGRLSFLQSAALMKDAIMNYVNDSAPMHLCSAVNAPTTAVYCSTIPEFGFGPLADDSVVVQVESGLYCRPCGLHGHQACPEKHFKCAYDTHISLLLDRISDKFDQTD